MNDTRNYSSKLRPLVEEYLVAIELKQHAKVFQLGLSIIECLVDTLDGELEQSVEFETTDNNQKEEQSALELKIVDTICHQLRNQGYIAKIYDKVSEFIHLRDIVCLSRVLEAIPATDDAQDSHKFNYEQCTRVLRQSIELLKHTNIGEGPNELSTKELWLDNNSLIRQMSISFPRYLIETSKALRLQEKNYDLDVQLKLLKEEVMNTGGIGNIDSTITNLLLNENWFIQFLNKSLLNPYPIDRFTILVAILIVGVECRHRELIQLIYELIDQVYHEEANSASSEDLLSLTQIGAIWLSHHKRHIATMKQANKEKLTEELEADDDLVYSSNTSSSASSLLLETGNNIQLNCLPQNKEHQSTSDLRFKIRRIIDDELLHGSTCLICNQVPTTDLLGPIKQSNSTCSKCGLNLSKLNLKCAISLQQVEILTLESLVELFKLSRLMILSPNEWIRELVAIKCVGLSENNNQVGEQVDISEKFERLTVIRRDESSNKYSPDSEDDEDDSDNESIDNLQESNMSSKKIISGDELSPLRNFMKFRCSANSQLKSNSLSSEFLLMLKYLRTGSEVDCLPVCSSDILVIDRRKESMKLGFVLTSSRNSSSVVNLQCSNYSSTSGLLLGCGQVFSLMELVRLFGQDSSLNEYKCPFCLRHLKPIRTFAESQFG